MNPQKVKNKLSHWYKNKIIYIIIIINIVIIKLKNKR